MYDHILCCYLCVHYVYALTHWSVIVVFISLLRNLGNQHCDNPIYPVLCPKLTLIQPTWSAYLYHLVFLICIRIPLFSLYGIHMPLFPYMVVQPIVLGMALLWAAMDFIVTRTAIVTSQWYDHYCFTEYVRTWARHPTTPSQCECTAITDRQSIESLLDSMRFVTHFWEITPYILRGAIVVLVQYQCYSINARAFGPRTPYWVGCLAGDVMHAWASHSLVNHWIYIFEASLLSTRYGQADVPREVSGRGGPAVRPTAADFPRDVCLTVSRNHAVFLFYAYL